MNTLTSTILICLAACCVVMLLIYIWAYKIKNASVVDIFWAFNFSIIAILLYFLGDGLPKRKILICGMLLVWSMRLGIYLLIRVGSHLSVEEGRYKKMREEWGDSVNRKLFIFFQAQALSNIYLAIPFFLAAFNIKEVSVCEHIGVAIWVISIIGEAF